MERHQKIGERRVFPILALFMLFLNAVAHAETKYYNNNTVCVRGFYLRELNNRPTDKWYMVVTLDISRDGRQVFDLIAGKCLVIGNVEAVIRGDGLMLTYHYLDGVKPHSEMLMLFPSIEDIAELEPGSLLSAYHFAEAISIKKDLQGLAGVFLCVNNSVSFTSEVAGLRNYTSLGATQIIERRAMAQSVGLLDVYREKVPIITQVVPTAAGIEVQDEDGCVGGVCPIR